MNHSEIDSEEVKMHNPRELDSLGLILSRNEKLER
jgi:hypothetical protein